MSSTIINNLRGIETLSYLELGVAGMGNFNSIKAAQKMSVDTNGNAQFTGTTDEYFSTAGDVRFDIIFIDANHDYDYVLRDYNNSVVRCNRWLLMHDMVPPNQGHTSNALCSDSYKLLYHLAKYEKFTMYTMNTNYGFTLVRMPAAPVTPGPEIRDLPWEKFQEFLVDYKLWSDEEIIKILSEG